MPAKSTITRQGDPSHDLFYVVSGAVTVRIEDEQGNQLVLAYLNAGEFFGEIGLFGANPQRSAVVRAMTHPDGMLVRVTRLELGDIVGGVQGVKELEFRYGILTGRDPLEND